MEIQVRLMTKEDFVKVMRHYGCATITVAKVDEQIASGAPVEADGRIHYVNYAAWLMKELAHGNQ